ncbi:MAG: hypothetical protein K5864_06750 [Bacteroidales bacterium]|nr:hypothetical protein [Bacteroidales bacterium]
MKLIKCNHCQRPYYDSEAKCPYCGHDTAKSIDNVVTHAISDPEAHHRMERMLSPDYDPRQNQPVVHPAKPVEQPQPEPEKSEVHEPVAEPVVTAVSETAQNRADAIAAIKSVAVDQHDEHVATDVSDVETTPLPKKRHKGLVVVIIMVVILLLAAAAAFCYLKWDFVKEKVPFLNKSEQVSAQQEPAPAAETTTAHADEILNENMETIEDEAIDTEVSDDPTEEVLEDLSLI